MAEKHRRKHKKHRGHRLLAGPQFGVAGYGGGGWVPYLGYATAQNPSGQEDDSGGSPGGEGSESE